jgi:hypothetical protein
VPYATIENWVEAGEKKSRTADGRSVSRLGARRLLRLHRGR